MNCIKNGKYTGDSCFGCEIKVTNCEIRDKVYRNRWIPVLERMPEFDNNCLVTTDTGTIITSKFYGYGEESQGFKEYPEGVWEIHQCGEDVIAWQPLPERYEAD